MPATMRDLWVRFMASALIDIRLSNDTEESTSPERQREQDEAYCVFEGVDESMPATTRDLWARFMASALMAIRLSHETDESTSPQPQQAQARG